MPEGITTENIMHNIIETLSDSGSNPKFVSFEDEKSNPVTSQFNRLFGHQKPVHHILGSGKFADVLLWRNKKITASVLTGTIVIWVLFEWLDYHFFTLTCLVVVLGMLVQFLLSNASGILNRSPSKVPCLVLPDELFANIVIAIGAEVNRALGFLQVMGTCCTIAQFCLSVTVSDKQVKQSVTGSRSKYWKA